MTRSLYTQPLINAGIDLNSNDALIKALGSNDVGILGGAIYLLVERNEKRAIPELRKLLGNPFDIIRLNACDALAQLGDTENTWRLLCIGLLQTKQSDLIPIRAAGILAKYGDYQGWPVVIQGLHSSDPRVIFNAGRVAPLFDGKCPAGEKNALSIIDIAIETFKQANTEGQFELIDLISQMPLNNDTAKLESIIPEAKSEQVSRYIQLEISRLKRQQ